MKILVTGGAGFIGSHIIDAYIKSGHDCVVIDSLATGKKEYLHPQATFYEFDIRQKQQISSVIGKEKPDIINHHAAQLDVRVSVADPIFDAQVNIIGLLNILEAAIATSVQKVIFASSGGVVYGDASVVPTPEDYQPLSPASPYGITKLASEYYLSFYHAVHNLPFIALRYANIYGPRQDPHGEAGVVAIFAQKMLKGEQAVINGTGEQLRDYTYVADVIAANQIALKTEASGIYNIGTGIGTSVNQIFQRLLQLTGANIAQTHGPAKPGEQDRSILDYTKFYTQYNWKPTTTLDDGLAQTVAYFKHETEKNN